MVLADASAPAHPEEIARTMADQMVHRGPDSSGVWSNDREDMALGHRRLAVVDLSEAGHQPMTSADGRWTITYNGELYNTSELRDRFGFVASSFRGHSDTEVLVEAIAKAGVDHVLETTVGMFAFAAFDRDRDELWIARDRFGEKPLYFTNHRGLFAFGSELRALRTLPGFQPHIDRSSVVDLLERSFIRAPFTIFEGISKLEAGTVGRVSRSGATHFRRFYDPTEIALSSAVVERSDEEAVEELETLLEQIVSERTIADVPLGAFLSGGIDSSLIVAMMQRLGGDPARTFTMGFEHDALNEAPAARQIASALGSDHREWIVTGDDALATVPELGRIYDEPFADSSQIPTILVSRFARSEVTVALSGDGGDELFGGYERYGLFERVARLHRIPRLARASGAVALTALSEEKLDRLSAGRVGQLLPRPLRNRTGRRFHSLSSMLTADSRADLYDLVIRLHSDGPEFVHRGERRIVSLSAELGQLRSVELGMSIDTCDYLPNDILTKVDRASMSTSLEVRSPLLDHRLHEFAWSLRPDQRARNGVGKWIMREAVRRHIPEIADLPKRGFGVPLDDWLRGPLREWGGDLVSAASIDAAGVLDASVVGRIWRRHQAADANLGAELWPILMLQAWIADHAD